VSSKEFIEKRNQEMRIKAAERRERENEERTEQEILEELKL
jgi:hypothetical protein